jgi:hypothetical protein
MQRPVMLSDTGLCIAVQDSLVEPRRVAVSLDYQYTVQQVCNQLYNHYSPLAACKQQYMSSPQSSSSTLIRRLGVGYVQKLALVRAGIGTLQTHTHIYWWM